MRAALSMRGRKGFFCENEGCAFALWKENRFFSSKKKTITKTVAAALLKEGRVSMSGLFSEKTGKTYDAVVVLDDTGEKYVNFQAGISAAAGTEEMTGPPAGADPLRARSDPKAGNRLMRQL